MPATPLSAAIAMLLVLLICCWAVKWMLNAIGIQFGGLRGGIKSKSLRRFRKGVVVFVAVLFVIGLLATYVSPVFIDVVLGAGHAATAGAEAVGHGASQAGGAVVSAGAIIVGVVLTLAYWTLVGVWSNKARTKELRTIRQVGAGVLYLLLFVVYIKLFLS